jgi:drug/metabolite transporter (DMT)-like permease
MNHVDSLRVSFMGPIALVALSLVAYQLAQRAISGGTNSWAPLLLAYAVGFVICGIAMLLTTGWSGMGDVRPVALASTLLGLSVVGIEFGYMQAHRAGWSLGAVGLVGSVAGTVLLTMVGATFLDESLSWRHVVGVAVCIAGLAILVTDVG